jgi:hypothetical protein
MKAKENHWIGPEALCGKLQPSSPELFGIYERLNVSTLFRPSLASVDQYLLYQPQVGSELLAAVLHADALRSCLKA